MKVETSKSLQKILSIQTERKQVIQVDLHKRLNHTHSSQKSNQIIKVLSKKQEKTPTVLSGQIRPGTSESSSVKAPPKRSILDNPEIVNDGKINLFNLFRPSVATKVNYSGFKESGKNAHQDGKDETLCGTDRKFGDVPQEFENKVLELTTKIIQEEETSKQERTRGTETPVVRSPKDPEGGRAEMLVPNNLQSQSHKDVKQKVFTTVPVDSPKVSSKNLKKDDSSLQSLGSKLFSRNKFMISDEIRTKTVSELRKDSPVKGQLSPQDKVQISLNQVLSSGDESDKNVLSGSKLNHFRNRVMPMQVSRDEVLSGEMRLGNDTVGQWSDQKSHSRSLRKIKTSPLKHKHDEVPLHDDLSNKISKHRFDNVVTPKSIDASTKDHLNRTKGRALSGDTSQQQSITPMSQHNSPIKIKIKSTTPTTMRQS